MRIKYQKEYPELLIEHMREGNSFESFGSVINVTTDAMNKWARKYKEFHEAKEIGRHHYLKYWEDLLKLGARGQLPPIKRRITTFNPDKSIKQITVIDEPGKFNINAVTTILKNRFRDIYRDKLEVEHSDKAIENLTDDEIKQRKALYESLVKK